MNFYKDETKHVTLFHMCRNSQNALIFIVSFSVSNVNCLADIKAIFNFIPGPVKCVYNFFTS